MRCLVTGATGHLGSHLVRLLVQEGHAVLVLVRKTSSPWRIADVADRVQFLYGCFDDLAEARADIHEAAPEALFHLAWQGVTRARRDDPRQVLTNVVGSLQLVETAIAAGCRCVVGVGSQAEYGRYDVPLREDLPTYPSTAYGVAKLCSGLLTQKLCESQGVRCVWLRLTATFGPADDETHLIPTVIRKLLARQRPALTTGEQVWDYLYAEDAARAVYAAARANRAAGIFNLAAGQSHAVRSIAESIRDLIDPTLPLGLGELPYAAGQMMRLEADTSRLTAAAAWRPQVSLDEGLRKTVAWYREHPAALEVVCGR